jgi:hypothetical protein
VGSGGTAPPFLPLALGGGKGSASRSGSQYSMNRRMSAQNRAGRCREEKNFLPCPQSNPSRPAGSPSLCRLSYSVSPRFSRIKYYSTMVILTSSCLSLQRWKIFNFTCLLTAQRQSRSKQRKQSKHVHTNKYNIIEGLLEQPQAFFKSSSALVSKSLLGYIIGQSGR